MSQAGTSSSVRVVLLQPEHGAVSDPVPSAQALARLGADVTLEILDDPAVALERLAAGGIDLVVADRGLGAGLGQLLAGLPEPAPPVVVVTAERSEAFAVSVFEQGAADCVAASSDYAETLPVVALEQIRRGRSQRRKGETERLGRQVDDLQSYTQNIIQNMNSALLVVGLDGRIRYANPTAERILDVPSQGLVGRPVWDWFRSERRDETLVAQTLQTGARFRGAETVLTRQDDSVLPIGISCAPLADGSGEQIGAVAIFQDLTEMKQLQRQVLQTEKMASIGQLAAGVAHEINNPMGFIHANLCQLIEYVDDLGRVWERVQALRKGLAGGAPDAAEAVRLARELDAVIEEVDADYLLQDLGKAVRESLEGSDRIRHIVRDLRAFSYQDTAERVEADVNKALDSTANIVWTMMKHSVVLTKHYEELPMVACFPMQLKQVFMNLLVNAYQAIEARDFGPDGRGEIRLRSALHEEGVLVSVTDNGIGMPPRTLDRIFDPFFTTKEVGVGTGLGLSTSFNLVRRHGGTIRAQSEPGVGTTFEIWLPLEARAPGTG